MDRYAKTNNFAPIVLAAVAIAVALTFTKPVMMPFVFALFLYAVLSPMLTFLHQRWKLPRLAAIFVTALLFLVVTTLLTVTIVNSLQDFYNSANAYQSRFVEFMELATTLAAKFGFDLKESTIRDAVSNLPALKIVQNLTGGVVGFLGNLALIVLFTLFMILGGGGEQKASEFSDTIKKNVSSYVSTKLVTSLSTGLLTWIVLTLFGIELAFMFGVLTFMLNFVPNIGSIVATVLPLPLVLLQFGFGAPFWSVLILLGAIQFSIGNVIEPKLMGDHLDMHPVTVLVCLIFWGLVWGIPGMFLAVPITALLKIVLSRIEATKPFADLLAGKLPA
jgi:AI-2 transport protein TqsA